MSVLYIVPTPIGNLGDITVRALQILSEVDFVAAEDTRVSLKLLTHFNIKKPLMACHGHNEREKSLYIADRITSGESCALITDAGTPGISDPGQELVRICAEAGIQIVPLPGPCAAICALSASGISLNRFCFEGFLSVNRKNRYEQLTSLKNESRTMVFYEAPHKLKRTLADMHAFWGQRNIILFRELTKIHEEILRTTLDKAILTYETTAPLGEFVLVVEGAPADKGVVADTSTLDLEKDVKDVLLQAKEAGISRNAAYRAKLKEKRRKEHEKTDDSDNN